MINDLTRQKFQSLADMLLLKSAEYLLLIISHTHLPKQLLIIFNMHFCSHTYINEFQYMVLLILYGSSLVFFVVVCLFVFFVVVFTINII